VIDDDSMLSKRTKTLLLIYCTGLIFSSFSLVYGFPWWIVVPFILLVLFAGILFYYSPRRGVVSYPAPPTTSPTFTCPMVPTIPLLGIATNIYMAANLQPETFLGYFLWLFVGTAFFFCIQH